MSERSLLGAPASPGLATGTAWRLDGGFRAGVAVPPAERQRESGRALTALSEAAATLTRLAAELPDQEAEIVAAGTLMAQDPALLDSVETAVVSEGLPAGEAILRATDRYAEAIASLPDALLAARAADVRSLGRRAARLATGVGDEAPPGRKLVLIAEDLGPADVAEMAAFLSGILLAGGGPTAHAAIVARSLGIPMVSGLGDSVLDIPEGLPLVLDGSSGLLVLEPSAESMRTAEADMQTRVLAERAAHELRDEPAVTADGIRVAVLVNVASPEELEVGRRAGAEGIGLVRTELAFLDAPDWPDEQQHAAALRPILDRLGGLPAVVRVLDFGADKSPPFLRGVATRGIDLLLAYPQAFRAQLQAMLLSAQRADMRILLPMVDTVDQLTLAGELIEETARSLGIESLPPVGPMIETPAAVRNVRAIAENAAFLSIGTNDLTASTLGAERFADNSARAHHPLVLRSIVASVTAAHDVGVPIEVCGEAASEPIMLPLLVGAGVDQLSVGAARVGEVRGWIRRLSARDASSLLRSALTMDSAEEVEWAVAPLLNDLRSPSAELSGDRIA